MKRQTIRSIRKGSVQWNEEDRLSILQLLGKAGYTVRIRRAELSTSGKAKQYEYVIEFWEEEDNEN